MNHQLRCFCMLLFLFLPTGVLAASSAEIVVVGGTPGGIAAALAAGREGRQVLLVAYQNHLGGMMSSGLGKSDVEDRDMIGGIFKEFVGRVYDDYVANYGKDHANEALCRDGYYYEPSVAEKVLEGMLADVPTIQVMRGWRPASCQVENRRLSSVEVIERATMRRLTLTAHVFIDATYEGDLYAAAGADFRLGREPRDEFDEPHAGVIYFDYQNKKTLAGTTGAGDDRLPAYTYRLCLTTDPDNAYRLTEPPPDYDRNYYLAYFDDLKAGRLDAPKSFKPGRGYNPKHFGTLVRALSVTQLPNNKTDVNINPRPLGFLFPEENRGYVLGDDATRQAICRRHRNLTLGLLWFLQNDSEVPAAHRELASELHLPKDEFRDNRHFPFQLYVREARRLVGEYTLSEHDITGKNQQPRRHTDSIAIGEFPIDSFPCRKRQPSDNVVLEGYLGMLDHITRPYEIPYRIMIPKQIDGLIVPVAASTTHVGFSSIRMEPTWMALGQAAGAAANLAVTSGVPPRAIPIKRLQQRLVEQGQVLRHRHWQPRLPHPKQSPDSPLMLKADWAPEDPHQIDFTTLPRVASQHVVVSDVRATEGVNQHNYLMHHDGKYWIMWSDGPGVEDKVGQQVKFATSLDGVDWSKPEAMTPVAAGSGPDSPHFGTRSAEGFRWISRGFWERDGKLLALASLDEAAGFFGPSLALHALEYNTSDRSWHDLGVIVNNAINNFPPKRLADGNWMMSRRTFDYKKTGVQFLVGGAEQIDRWESFPVLESSSLLAAEEPLWWHLPDGNQMALFRDNRRSGYLYRSFSTDQGRTWSTPTKTNFPDATSKVHGLRLADRRYVLVSNANPQQRDPLVLSISNDGMTFHTMAYLVGGRRVDYPHVLEHDNHLLVAFSGGKQTVEVLKIELRDLDQVVNATGP